MPSVVGLYEAHPATAELILDELREQGKLAGTLTPEDLFALDQDHYGGAEAPEALAQRAGVTSGDRVLDLCSGLGGPARFVAWRFDCTVTGIDLTPGRVRDAAELTELVELSDRVSFVCGDVTALPFSDGSF